VKRLGCPVANGHGPCNHLCGGGWPGTRLTSHQMELAVWLHRTYRLGCGVLREQAQMLYAEFWLEVLDDDPSDEAASVTG